MIAPLAALIAFTTIATLCLHLQMWLEHDYAA
jgi:hypothetical protein